MRRVLGNRGVQTLQRGNDKKESSIISHCLWKEGAFWHEFIREEKYRRRSAPHSGQHKRPQITTLPRPDPLLKGHRNPATWLKPKTLSTLVPKQKEKKRGDEYWGGEVEQIDGFWGNRKTLSKPAGLPPDSRCQSRRFTWALPDPQASAQLSPGNTVTLTERQHFRETIYRWASFFKTINIVPLQG